MKYITLVLPIFFCGLAIGCGNTAEGMKKDNQTARQNVASGASNMVDDASNSSEDMGVAAMLTPKVKLAITADKLLNVDGNLINVDSTSTTVSLKGHVTTEELRTLAGEIAEKTLKENDAKQTLDNQLQIMR